MSWPIRWIVWRSGPKILTDRKSTRLNSSHSQISYAVFCLKKKKKTNILQLYSQYTIHDLFTPYLPAVHIRNPPPPPPPPTHSPPPSYPRRPPPPTHPASPP